MVHLAFAGSDSNLRCLTVAIMISLWLPFLATAWTPAALLQRAGAVSSSFRQASHCSSVYISLPQTVIDSVRGPSSRLSTAFSLPMTSSIVRSSKSRSVSYRDHKLEVLLRHGTQEFRHHTLLHEVLIIVASHLLLESGETDCKILNLLTRAKEEVFAFSQSLQSHYNVAQRTRSTLMP